MITPEQMMEMKRQRPFRPFRVVMKSGETFEVLHHLDFLPIRPEISLPAGRRINGLPERGCIRHYEDIDRIEMIETRGRGAA